METQELRARREQRRRETRRRRMFAFAALLLTALAVLVAVLVASSSGGPSTGHGARPASGGGVGGSTASPGARGAGRSVGAPGGSGSPVLLGHPGGQAVPILMYHVIAPPPPGAPFPGLYVPPQEFAEQMQALKQAGWHAVTPDLLEAYWRRGVSMGAGKPIVLSFDNGYQSQYTQALPVLRRLGWVAEENIQLSGLPPSQGGLLQAQIRGLVAAGWELDTQGFNHADLIALDAAGLHYEVAVARQVLQRRFHVPVNWFCYPSGHYDPTVVAAVEAAGYTGSTTVVPGWAHRGDDPYRLHRLRVLGGTTPSQLLSLLAAIRADPPAPSSYTGA
jgi:peptidoglycan/xylan/chitin deacetylase (PgdA/CDA1 family)